MLPPAQLDDLLDLTASLSSIRKALDDDTALTERVVLASREGLAGRERGEGRDHPRVGTEGSRGLHQAGRVATPVSRGRDEGKHQPPGREPETHPGEHRAQEGASGGEGHYAGRVGAPREATPPRHRATHPRRGWLGWWPRAREGTPSDSVRGRG